MSTMSIKTNFPTIQKRINALSKDVANKVTPRALNATAKQGEAVMARTISREFVIGSREARSRLGIVRASKRDGLNMQAVLMASNKGNRRGGRGMNLIGFLESKTTRKEMRERIKDQTANQLRFKIKRGGAKRLIPGAFVATNKATGGTAVFVREGKDRMPIKPLTTIDVPQMFNTRRINGAVVKHIMKRFPINWKRELRSVSGGWVK